MSIKYEMQWRVSAEPDKRWKYFDTKDSIEELTVFPLYKKHSS